MQIMLRTTRINLENDSEFETTTLLTHVPVIVKQEYWRRDCRIIPRSISPEDMGAVMRAVTSTACNCKKIVIEIIEGD